MLPYVQSGVGLDDPRVPPNSGYSMIRYHGFLEKLEKKPHTKWIFLVKINTNRFDDTHKKSETWIVHNTKHTQGNITHIST